MKRVLQYLQGTKSMGIVFEQKDGGDCVARFIDFDYASDLNKRRSTSGYVYFHKWTDFVEIYDISNKRLIYNRGIVYGTHGSIKQSNVVKGFGQLVRFEAIWYSSSV